MLWSFYSDPELATPNSVSLNPSLKLCNHLTNLNIFGYRPAFIHVIEICVLVRYIQFVLHRKRL